MRVAAALTFLIGAISAEAILRTVPHRVSAEALLRTQKTWSNDSAILLSSLGLEPKVGSLPRSGELDSYILGRGLYDSDGGKLTRESMPESSRRLLVRSNRDDRMRERLRWEERNDRLGTAPWANERFQVVGIFSGGIMTIAGRDHDLPASPERSLTYYEARRGGVTDSVRQQAAVDILRRHEMARRDLMANIWESVIDISSTAEPMAASAYAIVDDVLYVIPAGSNAAIDEAIAEGRSRQEEHMVAIEKLLGIKRVEAGR